MIKPLLAVLTTILILPSAEFASAGMVTVPAGPFQMGCSTKDTVCEKDEGPQNGTPVKVPAFSIGTHEVTVAEYRACVKAGKCSRPKDFKRNKYCNYDASDRDNHPINCVDWSEADSYCTWKGQRLPREAEWEKAARAGSVTRYPWGQDVDCRNAILDDGKTLGSVADEPDGCGEDRSWPVGSRPANALGLFDMHGNAGEWTTSWYATDAITAMYAKGKLDGPDNGKQRVVRGGSWDENRANLRSSFRNVKPPVSGKSVYGSIGFRCASD
ncbi:Sulfatase modifying factor 1 precursor (C-alpha-formyglycine- generating enzyme 1) [hydrothermal vent metagenome]|uniref:Sulfatase modifying factor 1 (C-alpha-formyglycine- generating enzyme 1) n=1 Tax=hydrothermal vent metagenome TaxID=652676 RepID=A0A3B0YE11_9ZZZZ